MKKKLTTFSFGQKFVCPSEMNPAARRQLIWCGDKEVIAWCRKNKPDEIKQVEDETGRRDGDPDRPLGR